MDRIRILLADDHKEMRDRVVHELEPEFKVIGAVEDGAAVVETALKIHPDVCVLDISMPIVSGIEAASQLRASCSSVKIVFLTVHEDADFLEAALRIGALGYVLKSRLPSDLSAAIRAAVAGRVFISPVATFHLWSH